MRKWSEILDIVEQIEPGSKSQFKEKPKISIVGCFQNGKSTFVNCLLDDLVARPGDGTATTKISTRYRWGQSRSIHLQTHRGLQEIPIEAYLSRQNFTDLLDNAAFHCEAYLPHKILRKVDLIDTPGFNAYEKDTQKVTASLDESDYAIVVISNDKVLGQSEAMMFDFIKEKRISFAVVMNCKDVNTAREWFPDHQRNLDILEKNEFTLQSWECLPTDKIEGCYIYPCNFMWYLLGSNQSFLSAFFAEESEDIESRIERILIKKSLKLNNKTLLELSNFLPVQSFFIEHLSRLDIST